MRDLILQNASNGSAQINHFEEFGQSFTTIDTNVIFSWSFVESMNVNSSHNDNIIARLWEGNGTSGNLLDTSTMNMSSLSDGWVDIDFSAINLNIGSIYTVLLHTDGSSDYGGFRRSSSDFYDGGNGYIFGISQTRDLTFRVVGVDVPEPSTLVIFSLGLIGLASRRFKKHS